MSEPKADVVEALRAALKDRDRLRKENSRLLTAAFEPVAIVGMACRYPGGVGSPDDLWSLLASGADVIGDLPDDRGWDLEHNHSSLDGASIGFAPHGGFLHDAGDFDPEFFNISPREAMAMDPQQRLLLEGAWEALEGSGIDPASLRGEAAGVFAGISSQDYGASLYGVSPGLTGAIVAGRVAYALGLEGPTMTVDTACSSSLVAMHLASQALRAGECSLALAGGVTVLATPSMFTVFGIQGGLAPDGRCKSFAEAADGAGFSEGVGVLVLERLSDAKANGHRVLATIKGSAVNQDGASNGLTAPNGPSQERVIRQALANARLTTNDIDMVEAHGTGTTLGDPIEAGALLATYGQERETPLKLGSLKSNIGHTQAAAGVGGVIKAVMAMREGTMPKTLHVDAPSTKVEWEEGQVELLTEPLPWEANGRPRRAGVSSFGASGTNAHLILEEGPAPTEGEVSDTGETQPLPGPIPLALSAKSPEALAQSASRLVTHLKANPDQDLTDTAFSLLTTRSTFEHRAVVVAEGREEALAALAAIAVGAPSANATAARARSGRLAYLLTGQGSQRAGMGKELSETHPVYAKALEEALVEIDQHLDRPLAELLFAKPDTKEAKLLDHTTYAQPALFVTHIALYRLLESWGLAPDLLCGHSVGEISAAHISGVLSLPDAAKLICARSTLMGELPAGGAMLAVQGTEAEATEAIEGKEQELSLAAVNSPGSIVISGAEEAIAAQQALWEAKGRKTKRLAVSHAFHSPLIEPMQEAFAEVAKTLSYAEPKIPIISNLSGEILGAEQATDPAYWVSHVRTPVRFADSIATIAARGATTYVELGPDPLLSAMAAECLAGEERPAALLATLREGRSEPESLALALGGAHAAGAKVEWPSYFKGTGAKPTKLPTYPFQRKRYWLSAASGPTDARSIGQSDADHPLLGAVIADPAGEGLTLTGRLSLSTHPWLKDHAVSGAALLPGTAFLELALRAAEQLGCEQVAELTLQAPLVLPEQGAVQIQVSVASPDEDGAREIWIHSRAEAPEEEEAPWALNAAGLLSEEVPAAPEPLDSWPPQGAEPLEAELLYDRLAEVGLEYGPAFQGLTRAWKRGEEVFAEVSLAEAQEAEATRFCIHPALLDSALRGGLGLVLGGDGARPLLPSAWREASVGLRGRASLRARIAREGEGLALALCDEGGNPLGSIGSVLVEELDSGELRRAAHLRSLRRLDWTRVTPSEDAAEAPRLAILGGVEVDGLDGADRHADLAALLAAVADGAPPPDAVVLDARSWGEGGGDTAAAARAVAERALGLAQAWLVGEELTGSRLVFLTEEALATGEGESPDLATAPIVGLAASAHSEHPERFALLDVDGSPDSMAEVARALALVADEHQLAIRLGQLLAPRLTAVEAVPEQAPEHRSLDPERTVLITGGTSGLGALFARHLAREHGARRLLLVSRSGEGAEGVAELRVELEGYSAQVTIAACDVTDRSQLEELLASIPPAHSLGAVIHSAAIFDDATLESLNGERLERVMRPKVDAALHLHELTRDLDLSHFLLFSSAAGVVGGAGQAAYAAANVFGDALAAHRQAKGLPATSLAWGVWLELAQASLGDVHSEIIERYGQQIQMRLGLAPMSTEQGLELFDASLLRGEPLLVPAPFDTPSLRARASNGTLSAVLRGLVSVPAATRGDSSLALRLSEVAEADRADVVLELVRSHAASVLGHPSAADIEPERAFRELGFDSLAALELRNRLGAASGIQLAQTVVFDHPSAKALAAHLLAEATAAGVATRGAVRAQASDEPIAIVGMACRYPGGVSSPEQLWDLVARGDDGITEFPDDRGWDLEHLFDPDPANIGTTYARWGGFLDGAGDFDPEFFGIAPREAEIIDPQQRLLLESAWEALEDAAVDPVSLRGSAAGVFAGVCLQDYGVPQLGMSAGMTANAVSGRVAYTLGLEGPALTVDTACSSSLVAMHLASRALQGGECPLALVGGVTVCATPSAFTLFSAQRGLAADGRCKSFAEAADGTGFSEGVGMLVLERLSDAKANGHRVLATIKGSAVNQDGASNGFSAPNGPSQERVIRQALANARLTTKDIDMVEAHGTGTTLGDPIEAGALLATYGQERETPLKLGSLKSNIGHTQAAAGVGGVIKAVMAMREGTMPKTLHVDAPSTKVEWEEGQVELLTEPLPWQPNGHPRRAAVSSFGSSGTNAHLILEEAPAPAEVKEEGEQPLPGPIPLALSAKSPEALAQSASRLVTHLKANPDQDLTDTAFSLLTTRSTFEHRAVAVAEGREEALAALEAIATGAPSANATTARARSGRLAYLLTGQGSQRAGMGKELSETHPVYAKALEEALAEIDQHLDRPLTELLFAAPDTKEAKLLDHTTYAQPALFVTHIALYRLLESWGLAPDLLCGHSVGEISAAHISGVLSLPDAAKLICARSTLMGELPAGGAMLAIVASEAEATEAIAGKEQELSLAAVNSPGSLVISGTQEAIEAQQALWEAKGRKTKRLAVSHAFHSPLIEPMQEAFAEVAKTLSYAEPKIPVLSNLSGEVLSAEQATDPAYWVSHVRTPVRFADSIATIAARGASACLELGPDAVLSAMAAECLAGEERPAALLATLREGRSEPESLALALGGAHAAGAKVEWPSYFKGSGAKPTKLPTYPFQRKRYWLEMGSPLAGPIGDGRPASGHPLLGDAVSLARSEETLLTGAVSLQAHPWLRDHTVLGEGLVPGGVCLELALRAAEQLGCERVKELNLRAPLVLPEEGSVQLQVSVTSPDGEGEREIQVHSRREEAEGEGSGWSLIAEGVLAAGALTVPGKLEEWPPEDAELLDAELLYDGLAEAGFEPGPAFQAVDGAWRRGEEIFAEVSLAEAEAGEAARFRLHPALLEAALHAALALGEGAEQPSRLLLPAAWRDFQLTGPGPSSLRIQIERQGGGAASLTAFDGAGALVASVASVLGSPVDPDAFRQATNLRSLRLLEWPEVASGAGVGSIAAPAALVGDAEIPGFDDAIRFPNLGAFLAAVDDGADPPGVVLVDVRSTPSAPAGPAEAALAATERALDLAQAWICAAGVGRLVFLTEGAVAAERGESPDPTAAAVWGFVRCAQSEHPGRFQLIDVDGSGAGEGALSAALSLAQEPQLAIRDGRLRAPRLAGLDGMDGEPVASPLDPGRTVLISGGTRGLGALLARHLVVAHGARHLLLLSRSGSEDESGRQLANELEELGATVKLAACDVADRDRLAELIGSISPAHPLGVVVHCARVVDDGVLDSLDRSRLVPTMRAKANGAWNLHELTRDLEPVRFVLLSSAAGLFGAVGQAGHAAANAFLDALAAQRHAGGLDATSLAWGGWAGSGERGNATGRDAGEHLEQIGLSPMPSEQVLDLFDLAWGSAEPLLVPAKLDGGALRRQAQAGALPPILAGVVRGSRGGRAGAVLDLAGIPVAEREATALDLVRAHAAMILERDSAAEVEPNLTLVELGFNSLAAVDLRNRLVEATGLPVPVFALANNPTIAEVARHLLAEASAAGAGEGGSESPVRGMGTFVAQLEDAVAQGGEVELARALAAASKSRASIATLDAGFAPARAVRLAEGAKSPSVILVPSALAVSGPHEYARFAASLRGEHTVLSSPLLGFGPGEPLPADLGLAARAQIEAIRGLDLDSDVAVIGHSSGGWLAHAVVTELEAEGIVPRALVLLDSPWPEAVTVDRLMPIVMGAMLGAVKAGFPVDDDRLLAMAAYLEMLGERTPTETATPTVLVRARDAMPGVASDAAGGLLASWKLPHTAIDVDGNHFNMVLDHAEGTAEAVLSVLAGQAQANDDRVSIDRRELG